MFRSNKKEVINSVINQNGTRHSCKSRNPGKSWIQGQARNDGLCKTYVVMYILITVISLFFLGISGCSKRPAPVVLPKPEGTVVMPRPYKVLGKWYQPIPDSKGFREKGVASW